MFNFETGEDDDHPLGGDIGEQGAAPFAPMPPPVAEAPGPEMPSPAPAVDNAIMPPTPGVLPAPAPQVAPYLPQPAPPIPPSRVVTPAEAANLGALDRNAAARTATAQDAGNVNLADRAARAQAADAQNGEAQRFLQERQRIADDATKRIQERQQQANADYQAFKQFGIKDPEANDSFATRILKAIAVGLGGYAAGINGGPNQALQIIQQANADNIARQKAQQEKLFQVAQRSGKDVEGAKEERDDAFKQLDLKHSALLESSAGMLRSELARLGVPQAQIDANKDIQKIEQEALGLRERTLAGIRDDETSLARADIAAAGRRAKHAAAGGGGGGAGGDKAAQLAKAIQDGMPYPEQITLAAKLGIPTTAKAGHLSLESIRTSIQRGTKGEDLHTRATDRQEGMQITGVDGKELGQAHSPQDATQLRKANIAYDQFRTRVQALIDDVKKSPRAWSDEDMARRDSLAAAVAAAGRKYNELGVSNANVQLEKQMIGPTGSLSHGIVDMVRGGKVDVLQHMLDEADTRHNAQLETYLRKGAPGASARAGGGEASAPQRTLKVESTLDKALASRARAVKEGDPLYDSAQRWLRAHGL